MPCWAFIGKVQLNAWHIYKPELDLFHRRFSCAVLLLFLQDVQHISDLPKWKTRFIHYMISVISDMFFPVNCCLQKQSSHCLEFLMLNGFHLQLFFIKLLLSYSWQWLSISFYRTMVSVHLSVCLFITVIYCISITKISPNFFLSAQLLHQQCF